MWLTSKLYLPTALVAMQLPAGLADLQTVPRLLPPDEWHDEEARLQEYVEATWYRGPSRVLAAAAQHGPCTHGPWRQRS